MNSNNRYKGASKLDLTGRPTCQRISGIKHSAQIATV